MAKPTEVFLDLETRSRCDLPTRGAYNYADDPSTEILVVAWAVNDGPVKLWTPPELHDYEDDPVDVGDPEKCIVWAHNAQFDREVYSKTIQRLGYDLPRFDLKQWRCSATLARANNLPGGLDAALKAAKIGFKKNPMGKRFIQELSDANKPWGESRIPWLTRMREEYAKSDVEGMRALIRACDPMDDVEWDEYVAGEVVNKNGFGIDTDYARAAAALGELQSKLINERLKEITGDKGITNDHNIRKSKWLIDNLPERLRKLALSPSTKRPTCSSSVVGRLLKEPELPPKVREFLEAVHAGNQKAYKKYARVLQLVDENDRVRGAYLTNGAGQTGRYAGRDFQPHNLKRDVLGDFESAMDDICAVYERVQNDYR